MAAWRRPRTSFLVASVTLGVCLWGTTAESQDPSRWEDAMRAFGEEDRTSPPPSNAIVFVGSSSIRFWDTLARDMDPLRVIQRGFGGSTMEDALYWIDTLVLQHKPRAVVLYEGDNDIGSSLVSPEDLLEGFETFVARVREDLPETRIYFLAVKPSILRWARWPETLRANALIREASEADPLLTFIDVASPMLDDAGEPIADIFVADDLHMNAKGYEIWTSIVRPILLEREGVYESTDAPPRGISR